MKNSKRNSGSIRHFSIRHYGTTLVAKRNPHGDYLFGFRADLYAEGFTKMVSDWSLAHGITATGHIVPEEVLNPRKLMR